MLQFFRSDGTAAFAEYVENRNAKDCGFGDQNFDEAARNLGMEYDEGAFNQQGKFFKLN